MNGSTKNSYLTGNAPIICCLALLLVLLHLPIFTFPSSTQKGKTKRRNRSGGAQNGADTPESLQPATRNPLGRKKRTAAQGANAASSPASGNLEATTEATADGPPLSSRQRNRLSRQVRSGARAASSLTAPAGKEGGDIGGKSSCVGGGGGHTGREDGPPAFLGRTGGMMDLAMDARGTLVSLAADLVAQVVRRRRKDRVGLGWVGCVGWARGYWGRSGRVRVAMSCILFLCC